MEHQNKSRAPQRLIAGGAVILAFAGSGTAHAWDLKLHGYGSVIAGQILTGDPDMNPGAGQSCPCNVVEWPDNEIYTGKKVQVTPETHAGVQLNLEMTSWLSAVGQLVGRTVSHNASLDWAYLSADLGSHLTIQAGQKRIPIYYYSEYQDVGYAYMLIRQPQEVYGWDMTNYQGASARYREELGDVSLNFSVFGGNGKVTNSPYYHIYGTDNVDVRWKNIFGSDLELVYKWATARFVYIHSTNEYNDTTTGTGWDNGNADQKMYGMALNLDFDRLFVLSEFNLNRKYIGPSSGYVASDGSPLTPAKIDAPNYTIGAGYKIGDWTPFVNYSSYREYTTTHDTYKIPWYYDSTALVLRYDFAQHQDVKLQYTKTRDMNPPGGKWMGNSQLISLAYDVSL